jgi:hypothetical protein
MHDRLSYEEFLAGVSGPLGGYFLLLAAMNGVAAACVFSSGGGVSLLRWRRLHLSSGHLWLVLVVLFAGNAVLCFRGDPASMAWVAMPAWAKDLVDRWMSPTWYTIGLLGGLLGLFLLRRFFVQPTVAWLMLNFSLWFMGASLTDENFVAIVSKPDNVPIVGMVYLLGFFTWLSAYRAVQNDDRRERGEPPLEAVDDEKTLVWPDLVYIELICMVAVTALLIVWAIVLKAPLEEPANAAHTPNPSKAPWYFLGLQELLVYFDPWLAGVVLPGLILVGLIAIPYLDPNPEGVGYYTIKQRPFAYVVFQFGFLGLWISLILMGTFLRGPNWSFFGIYETWDVHKSLSLHHYNLSDYFWIWMLGRELPTAPPGSGAAARLLTIVWRELPGLVLLAGYFVGLPVLAAWFIPLFRKLYGQMGWARFAIMAFLLMWMILLPIKMLANWHLNLQYFVAIPEWTLNL